MVLPVGAHVHPRIHMSLHGPCQPTGQGHHYLLNGCAVPARMKLELDPLHRHCNVSIFGPTVVAYDNESSAWTASGPQLVTIMLIVG